MSLDFQNKERSDAQKEQSRINGAKSQGPLTEETANRVRYNAYKHGLTSRTLILRKEDMPAYEKLHAAISDQYRPVTIYEKHLIEQIANDEWKISAAVAHESGMLAYGRDASGDNFAYPDDEGAASINEGMNVKLDAKAVNTFSILISRAQSRIHKRIKQYNELREEREVISIAMADIAMASIQGDKEDTRPPHKTVGTVFSIQFLAARIAFKDAAPTKNIAVFDRTWSDKMAKTAN